MFTELGMSSSALAEGRIVFRNTTRRTPVMARTKAPTVQPTIRPTGDACFGVVGDWLGVVVTSCVVGSSVVLDLLDGPV